MGSDSKQSTTPRIDAHHHLWRYTPEEYDWIDGSMFPLRRNFLLPDLHDVLRSANVDGTVVVQARQTIEETDWLLSLAETSPAILAVVGWLPLAQSTLRLHLERLRLHPCFKAVRHVVQAEPEGFLDDPAFNAGIAELTRAGLLYEILILERQLPEATRFVDRHPSQAFVLDHIAKPKIATHELEPWRSNLRTLAQRPNVSCKLSGMVTEADPHRWTPEELQPYVDTVLEAFGPDRLMIGTDWPVLTLGCAYTEWWRLVEQWIAPLSPAERAQILGATAARVYGLEPTSHPQQQNDDQMHA